MHTLNRVAVHLRMTVILVSFALPVLADPPKVTCESLSQSPTMVPNGGNLAVLLATAPPGATGIKINLYGRGAAAKAWTNCGSFPVTDALQITRNCKGVGFGFFTQRVVPPEGYHSYKLNAYEGCPNIPPFGPCPSYGRMGVQYDSPDGHCVATQIDELGPRDERATILLLPPGKKATSYRQYRKVYLEPPPAGTPISNWVECTGTKCGTEFPIMHVDPTSDVGADKAQGYLWKCANTDDGKPPNVWVAHDACRLDVPYDP